MDVGAPYWAMGRSAALNGIAESEGGVMAGEWIKRLADDERQRDGARDRQAETAARKADVVRVHGRRLLEELRATVTRDVEAFRNEFTGDDGREIVFDAVQPDGGFVVRRPAYPAVSLNVAPRLGAAAIGCQYHFTANNGLPPREERLELVFVGEAAETLQIKHQGTGQVFATSDTLSEYLLTPVLTGRCR